MGKRDRQILENVVIETVAAEGNALAHYEGRALFVPVCIPGDVVDVQITHKRSSYMMGYVIRMVKPSPLRVEPFCSHFGDCGGCKWQPLPYEKQLEFKQQQVIDQLSRIGKLDLPPISAIMGSERTICYRNKLEFTFSNDRWKTFDQMKEESPADNTAPLLPSLGFHISGRFDKVLDIEWCYLQDEPSNAIRLSVRDYAIKNDLSFFDLRAQTGFLRTLMVRITTTGQVMVVVVFAHDNPAKGENHDARLRLMEHIKKSFPGITSLQYIINTKKNDSFADLPVVPYTGNAYITERMENLEFRIGPKSFYQTNSRQAYRLYDKVREMAQLNPSQHVYDLYTGTGTIALFLSGLCRRVTGIEYVPEAIEDARENARINGITNACFFAGDMKDILTPRFIAEEGRPDVVVLDPPRAGVHEDVLKVLMEAAPQRIIYVSCNPATQARDLRILSTMYRVTCVQPVDMFPHTHHVENIVSAEKIPNTI
jgi:23S rRNA (uracil1939-C5)-methyltransferase